MNIRALIVDSLKQRLLLNVLFFCIFGRRLKRLARVMESTSQSASKRSPFVYNMR
jgi:hypothetical protein